MLPYIILFDKQIPLYGICFYGGIFLAALVAVMICQKRNIERFDVVCSAIYTMIGAILGSKLLFIAVSWKQIIEMHLSFMDVLKGGFVFYGGLLGGILGLFIYCMQFQLSFAQFGDMYATVLPLGHALGRVGCFFAGCCYGVPYDGPFAYTYIYSYGMTPLGIPLFPVQLMEALLLMLIFVASLVLYNRRSRQSFDQCLFYLVSYSFVRFVLEFLRGDVERGTFGLFSTSQWISMLLFGAAIVLWIYKRKRQSDRSLQTQ